MSLKELIEELEKLRAKKGDNIQVVLRTQNIKGERSWCHDFSITIWEEKDYLDEISIQDFV